MHLKMSFAKGHPFCSGLTVVICFLWFVSQQLNRESQHERYPGSESPSPCTVNCPTYLVVKKTQKTLRGIFNIQSLIARCWVHFNIQCLIPRCWEVFEATRLVVNIIMSFTICSATKTRHISQLLGSCCHWKLQKLVGVLNNVVF